MNNTGISTTSKTHSNIIKQYQDKEHDNNNDALSLNSNRLSFISYVSRVHSQLLQVVNKLHSTQHCPIGLPLPGLWSSNIKAWVITIDLPAINQFHPSQLQSCGWIMWARPWSWTVEVATVWMVMIIVMIWWRVAAPGISPNRGHWWMNWRSCERGRLAQPSH